MLAAERYVRGIGVDEYLARMHENRERFLENMDRTEITDEDRARFGRRPLHILVLTEDWCNDSVQFVAAAARLAQAVPEVELRILSRDENLDLAGNYRRKDGYQAIPTFILLDDEMNEIGLLVERPARATEEIAAETRRFQRAHPDLPGITRMVDHMPDETRAAVKANTKRWRVDNQERWARYVLEDLADIVEQAERERAA